jgi:hypothetical protein
VRSGATAKGAKVLMPTAIPRPLSEWSDEEIAAARKAVLAKRAALFAATPLDVWIYQKVRWLVRRVWRGIKPGGRAWKTKDGNSLWN